MEANMAKITGNVSGMGAVTGALSQMLAPSDYNVLANKPRIEGRELVGDKTFPQLGLDTATQAEVEAILYLP